LPVGKRFGEAQPHTVGSSGSVTLTFLTHTLWPFGRHGHDPDLQRFSGYRKA
jgi:hypothetical protein